MTVTNDQGNACTAYRYCDHPDSHYGNGGFRVIMKKASLDWRSLRGGAWTSSQEGTSATFRSGARLRGRGNDVGFRVVSTQRGEQHVRE